MRFRHLGLGVLWLALSAWNMGAVAAEECVSQARWLWAAAENGIPPTNAYLRLGFEVDGAVTNAWFQQFADKRCKTFLNGRQVGLQPRPENRKYFGHVKGYGLDLKPLLKSGRNVLAFELGRTERGCYGLILRGEVDFADGRKLQLFSHPDQVKGAGMAPEGWQAAGFDDSAWQPAVSRGDVRMAPWTTYGSVPEMFMTPEEFARYDAECRRGLPIAKLLAEPSSPNARIVYSGGTPGIEVNGEVLAPYRLSSVSASQSAAQDRMLAHARAIGLRIFEMEAGYQYLTGDGGFDFSQLDRAMCHILARWPEAYVVFGFHLRFYIARWLKEHPEELVGYAIKRDGRNFGDYSGNPQVPSFASEAYRAEIRRFILALGEYSRSKPWGRRVLGMHDGYGGSGDGMPYGCHSWPDTGVRMTEAFRRFLRRKYVTDTALQRAWQDSAVTLDTATVPDATRREGSGMMVRDLAIGDDCRRADFLEAYHREFNDYELAFCRAVKEAFPGALAGAYYGYVVLSYESEGSTARFEELLARPEVDYMKATTRGYNLMDGLHRHLPTVFHSLKKLSSIEGDVRTHLGLVPGQAEAQWCCRTPEETRSTVAKFVGNALLSGAGWHSVDFGIENLKWFDCPEALEPMRTGLEEWKKRWRDPAGPAADVAVVFDPKQVWREGRADYRHTQPYQDNLVTYALQTLNFSGYAYDLEPVESFADCGRKYRAVIFLNTCADTPALRAAAVKARRDGATCVWCGTPAISTAEGFSEKSMAEVTGIELGFVTNACGISVSGVNGADGYGNYTPFAVKRGWKERPRVWVKDRAAERLGAWTDDGSTAIARKRLADGSVAVFLGMPFNRAADWAALLAEAGCHRYTEPGFFVRRNSRYLMVFSGKGGLVPPESAVLKGQVSQSGRVRVTLDREAATVRDVFSGEVVARGVREFELESDHPRVWLFDVRNGALGSRRNGETE